MTGINPASAVNKTKTMMTREVRATPQFYLPTGERNLNRCEITTTQLHEVAAREILLKLTSWIISKGAGLSRVILEALEEVLSELDKGDARNESTNAGWEPANAFNEVTMSPLTRSLKSPAAISEAADRANQSRAKSTSTQIYQDRNADSVIDVARLHHREILTETVVITAEKQAKRPEQKSAASRERDGGGWQGAKTRITRQNHVMRVPVRAPTVLLTSTPPSERLGCESSACCRRIALSWLRVSLCTPSPSRDHLLSRGSGCSYQAGLKQLRPRARPQLRASPVGSPTMTMPSRNGRALSLVRSSPLPGSLMLITAASLLPGARLCLPQRQFSTHILRRPVINATSAIAKMQHLGSNCSYAPDSWSAAYDAQHVNRYAAVAAPPLRLPNRPLVAHHSKERHLPPTAAALWRPFSPAVSPAPGGTQVCASRALARARI
ncbi:hypothetical protein DFH09DRAFT_1405974 [Mycena vulgaris]|nr:hypothetical protein DFH09DRAFT_1405974 [Mycena vulgaris]